MSPPVPSPDAARANLGPPTEIGATMPEMTKERCRGCHNDVYNHGLGGAKECWSFKDAKVILRKAVHLDQVPPWTQKAEQYPNCYVMPRHIFVKPERVR